MNLIEPKFKKGDTVVLINNPEIKLTVLSIKYNSNGEFAESYICNYSDKKESKNQLFMEAQLELERK